MSTLSPEYINVGMHLRIRSWEDMKSEYGTKTTGSGEDYIRLPSEILFTQDMLAICMEGCTISKVQDRCNIDVEFDHPNPTIDMIFRQRYLTYEMFEPIPEYSYKLLVMPGSIVEGMLITPDMVHLLEDMKKIPSYVYNETAHMYRISGYYFPESAIEIVKKE